MLTIGTLFIVASIATVIWVLDPTRNRASECWRAIWVSLAASVFALSAFRVGGSDWENYDTLYDVVRQASSLSEAIEVSFVIEPLYVALNYFFGLHFNDRRPLVIFESAVNAWAIYLLATRTRGGPILLIWLFPLQFLNILGVRQTLAASLIIISLLLARPTLRTLAVLSAPFLHLSAAFLFAAHLIRSTRLTISRGMAALALLGASAFVMRSLLSEKIDNYLTAASELTDLGSTEVVIGKLATLGFLGALAIVANAGSPKPTNNSIDNGTILFALATVATFTAFASPALIRLTAPIEFVIAWYCAGRVASVRDLGLRVALLLVLQAACAAKLAKIFTQFADVYEVCFFCGT